MPLFDETHVKIQGCIVIWDGINRPEEANANGNIKRSLKVVIPPNNPDIGVLQQLATNALQASEFKGNLPQGGIWPINLANHQKLDGMFEGYAAINCRTFRMPDVYNEQGQMMSDPMQYLPMIYTGQVVDVLVSCSVYNDKSKGVAVDLDGFMIMASNNAQRLNIGGGGVDTSGAFGANAQGGQPQGQGQPQGGYNPNAQGGQPQGQGQPQGGAPNQAHNYMPNNGGNNNQ